MSKYQFELYHTNELFPHSHFPEVVKMTIGPKMMRMLMLMVMMDGMIKAAAGKLITYIYKLNI
jgi:hypothetical protein